MEEEIHGISKEHAHARAVELVPEAFFWSCVNELAPFGSDEGDTALSEFRDWRLENPNSPSYECLKWVIEGVGDMYIEDYNDSIIDRAIIKAQIADDNFDDKQFIYTLDTSVIATGFGQLVDEGKIDAQNKPLIKLAINRQKIWVELKGWEYRQEYIDNLNVLIRVLSSA